MLENLALRQQLAVLKREDPEAQARSTREILLGCCSRLGAGYGDTAQQA
jgi:hypothetical protein